MADEKTMDQKAEIKSEQSVLATTSLPASNSSLIPCAVILSLNMNRMQAATKILNSLGIMDVRHKKPIPRNDSRIDAVLLKWNIADSKMTRGYTSNMLSFTEAYQSFANEQGHNNSWCLFIEDDISLNP